MVTRQVGPIWAACLVAVAVGCNKDRAGPEETAAEEEDAGDYVVAVDDLVLRTTVIGERDEADRYFSTVAWYPVSAPKGLYREGCNGVLVGSKLVLTAAHCLCAPSRGETIRFDGSECATNAKVIADYWNHSADGDRTTGTRDEIAGDVLIHPRFQIVLDSQGAVVSSRADLALIRLKRPVPPKIDPVRLAAGDVQVGETVSVVGLGYDSTGHVSGDLRYSSREKVQAPAGEDRLLFGSMDQADYKGDTGGPCLRETKRGIELVGISQRGLGRTPTFTRIVPYREWLGEQIRGASGKP